MAGVKGRLNKLEQESQGLFQSLTLEDGTKTRYEPEEMLDAISAALPGLINALEASHARVEGGD
jgi:hypothetical protein